MQDECFFSRDKINRDNINDTIKSMIVSTDQVHDVAMGSIMTMMSLIWRHKTHSPRHTRHKQQITKATHRAPMHTMYRSNNRTTKNVARNSVVRPG